MLGHQEMVHVVDAYIAAIAASDVEAMLDLFAADATVEDPVGSEPHKGLEAIRNFYTHAMQIVTRLELDGPVRTVNGVAAFALNVLLTRQSPPMRVAVIELFRFNEAGKIASMQAYFNEANFSIIE